MAVSVKLFEHRDFRQLITRVAAERAVDEAWIEKDYYLSEVLRVIAETYPNQTMLKGGTSLSKGWLLLDRISEDIDLFVDPEAFPRGANGKVIGQSALETHFKRLRDAIAKHPALNHDKNESKSFGGFGRSDRFAYERTFDSRVFTIAPWVLVEAGVQSGREPKETRRISSLIGEYATRIGQATMALDTGSFVMQVLHFRRTFVEKMFAIHGKVMRFMEDGTRIGRDARHYADLYVLAAQPDVRAMLTNAEYERIRMDYDANSRKYFAKSYRPPENLRFKSSAALFPTDELRSELQRDYDSDVKPLFFGGAFPPFDRVLDRLKEIQALV